MSAMTMTMMNPTANKDPLVYLTETSEKGQLVAIAENMEQMPAKSKHESDAERIYS